jgi:class 3 adenylate cyclase
VAGVARGPRRFAYWGGALLLSLLSAQSATPPLLLGIGYLLLSPPCWDAWSARHRCGLGSAEVACTTGIVLAAAPMLCIAVDAWLGLAMGAVSLAGLRVLPRLLAALAAGTLAGGLLSGIPDRGTTLAELAALAWLAAFCGAVAWLAHRQSVRLDAARQSERARSAALAEVARRLSRYLSPQLHRQLFDGAPGERAAARRRWLTVFFSDIEGFTAASESLDAEETTRLLNDYLDAMAGIALAHGGTIDKFIGDGMLVFFGDPAGAGRGEDACACVRMALAMQARAGELSPAWHDAGIRGGLRVRMGIASGTCTVGDFGSSERLDYTAVGRAVNLASRLEKAARPGQVLLSASTAALVGGHVPCRSAGQRLLKGMDAAVEVFEVAAAPAAGAARVTLVTGPDRIHIRAPGVAVDIEAGCVTSAGVQRLLATLHEATATATGATGGDAATPTPRARTPDGLTGSGVSHP